MLQPPGGFEGELEFAELGSAGQSPFSAYDPSRTAGRLKEREEKRQACMCAFPQPAFPFFSVCCKAQ